MFWGSDKLPPELLSPVANISLLQAAEPRFIASKILVTAGGQTSEEVHTCHRGSQSKYLFVQRGISAKLSHGTSQLLHFFQMELCQGMLFQPHMK